MLTKDFCTVHNLVSLQGTMQASLQWNAGHAIFSGHFPGQPVVPGVCMLQILAEMLASGLGKPTRLMESVQMKFLMFIDPRVSNPVDILVSYVETGLGTYKVNATLQKEKEIYFKFSGVFAVLVTNEEEK